MENDFWDLVRENIIGRQAAVRTPFGERRVTYADHTASGRGVRFIEGYLSKILELYGNTHTEDDATGAITSRRLRQVASAWKWTAASTVGLGAGGGLGILVIIGAGGASPSAGMALIGGMAGLGIGLGQWLVLRPRMSGIWQWLIANAGALALGLSLTATVVNASRTYDEMGGVIILTLGCALQSAVAGWLLPRLLKPVAK